MVEVGFDRRTKAVHAPILSGGDASNAREPSGLLRVALRLLLFASWHRGGGMKVNIDDEQELCERRGRSEVQLD